MANSQRLGSISNSHVGKEFEDISKKYFEKIGMKVKSNYSKSIGFQSVKKAHAFDLGGTDQDGKEIVVECKSHTWTTGENIPSAKITVWSEVMLYFSLLPDSTRKVLFVIRDFSVKKQETLAEYYVRTHSHLIPSGVQIMEYDSFKDKVELIYE